MAVPFWVPSFNEKYLIMILFYGHYFEVGEIKIMANIVSMLCYLRLLLIVHNVSAMFLKSRFERPVSLSVIKKTAFLAMYCNCLCISCTFFSKQNRSKISGIHCAAYYRQLAANWFSWTLELSSANWISNIERVLCNILMRTCQY